jgi:hypothetical protein
LNTVEKRSASTWGEFANDVRETGYNPDMDPKSDYMRKPNKEKTEDSGETNLLKYGLSQM